MGVLWGSPSRVQKDLRHWGEEWSADSNDPIAVRTSGAKSGWPLPVALRHLKPSWMLWTELCPPLPPTPIRVLKPYPTQRDCI